MILNYRYRIYPDAQQVGLLNEWLETCRVSYNYALRELKDWIASRKCSVDRCSLTYATNNCSRFFFGATQA